MRMITILCILILDIPEAFAQGIAEDTSPRIFQTTDDLGRQVLQCIATGNYKRLKNASALILSQKDMKQIGKDLIKSVEQKINKGNFEKPADGHAVIQGIRGTFLNEEEIKKQFAKLKQEEMRFKKSFNQTHGMSKIHGFDWQKTKYLRTDSSRIKKDNEIPMPIGNLFIHFMGDDREFRIKLPNCAKIPTLGWLTDSDPLSLEPVKKAK